MTAYSKERMNDYKRQLRLTKTGWSKHILNQLRSRAKAGIPFNLTLDDVKVPELCPALQVPIIMGDFRYGPSVDRTIPELGYVKGNVVVISRRANMIKQDCTDPEELRLIADFVERGLTPR